MRVSMSATGSVIIVGCLLCLEPTIGRATARLAAARPAAYQLAFTTPGISPLLARFRKQIRQMRNFRM
jgi:hypothetical protein